MEINVIDIGSSLIKIITLEKEPQAKPKLTKVVILDTGEIPRKTAFLELRNAMTDNDMLTAEKNIFLVGKELATSVVPIDNSVDQKEIKKLLKQLKEDTIATKPDEKQPSALTKLLSSAKKQAEKIYVIEQESRPTDHKLFPLKAMIPVETLEEYMKFIKLLNLRGPVLTDYSFYSKLYHNDYTVLDYGARGTTAYKVSDRKLIDIIEISAGMTSFFQKLDIKDEACYNFNNLAIADLPSDLKDSYHNVVQIHNTNVPQGSVYATGGGAITPTLTDTNNRKIYSFTSKLQGDLQNKYLPEPILRYTESMILAGVAVANECPIYNLLGNSKEVEIPALNALTSHRPKIVAALIVSTALLFTSSLTLGTIRGVYNSGVYQSSSITEAIASLPSVLTSMYKVEKDAVKDFSVEIDELSTLYDEASDKLMAIDDLSKLQYQGTSFNDILEKTNTLTEANLVSIQRLTESSLTYTFRGNIGDIPKVEAILKPHYKSVEYKVNHIDDLNSFSVINFEFTVNE